jgi:glycosyltransferase involved in cell wall biosynthesis
MNSFVQTDLSLSRRAMLWAQRNSWRLPRGLTRAARKLIMGSHSSSGKEGILDDWSKPLVPYDSSLPIVPDLYPTTPLDLASVEVVRSPHCPHCLIVTQWLDSGGLDEIVAFLARRLPLMGFRVTVMWTGRQTTNYAGQICTALQREGITVLVVASRSDGFQWIAANRPDVISAHDPPDWILKQAGSAGIPIVETLHGLPTPIGTDWSREAERSKFITFFVAVSELVKRQYLRGNPSFPEHAIVTIPNAFNDTHRPPCDRSIARAWLGLKNEFLFLTLGRHSVQKNAYGLLEAFSKVAQANPNAHLLIAGRLEESMYTDQVRALRDKLPSKGRIHLRHAFSNPSVLLAAADCFVLNSFFEGWSLASMEALSAGLPAILSEVGGAREQLGTDGSRGFVVANPLGNAETANFENARGMFYRPQRNRDELVAAMNSVITHREQWAAARRDLSENSKKRFSAEGCAKRHAEVLLHAISQG